MTVKENAPVLAGIHTVSDIDAASDFEKKHTPYVEVERTAEDTCVVTAKVGHWVSHPNQADHWIEYLEVFVDDAPVARFHVAAVAVDPEVKCVVHCDPGSKITVVERCNLHGLWAGSCGC